MATQQHEVIRIVEQIDACLGDDRKDLQSGYIE